jgi:hypothetical protein
MKTDVLLVSGIAGTVSLRRERQGQASPIEEQEEALHGRRSLGRVQATIRYLFLWNDRRHQHPIDPVAILRHISDEASVRNAD